MDLYFVVIEMSRLVSYEEARIMVEAPREAPGTRTSHSMTKSGICKWNITL